MRKKITREELDAFLRKHKLWLADDPEGERADLSGADLSGADLYGADLRCPITCPEKGAFIGYKKSK